MSNEHIWYGKFGTEYTARNDRDFSPRYEWWRLVCEKYDFDNVLEVGCNNGMNISHIASQLDHPSMAWGCDINPAALELAKQRHPGLNIVMASGLDLPFKDDYFGMVFTAGVLIHQTPATVETMMQEIIRVSRQYVMAIEYENDIFTEIPYRGLTGALFKGPWGEVYEKRYGLKLIEKVYLDKEMGFDRCCAWCLTKK